MHDDSTAEVNSNKIMSSVIISIINDSDFWLNLAELEQILYPFCATLNILQRDKARLYDILHSFGYFMQCTLENNDENYNNSVPELSQIATRLFSICVNSASFKNDRIAVSIGNDVAEDHMELLELDTDNDKVFYDEIDKENNKNNENNKQNEFIRSWFKILEEEDTNNKVNNISGDEINKDSSKFNALLKNQIHPADNDDAK
ncbi:ribonuclease H-like domain-containing protein [Rhizophagus clarus]|uniref:Ribonuclease H-like domain-containing protein n=1 Tax=Rhizophagus clarus TaxID=94130 RepID=A0A8H3QZ49_9GLOM|nr:ribonuclease H-like domain-containing protein [Rhizophagus clarus]